MPTALQKLRDALIAVETLAAAGPELRAADTPAVWLIDGKPALSAPDDDKPVPSRPKPELVGDTPEYRWWTALCDHVEKTLRCADAVRRKSGDRELSRRMTGVRTKVFVLYGLLVNHGFQVREQNPSGWRSALDGLRKARVAVLAMLPEPRPGRPKGKPGRPRVDERLHKRIIAAWGDGTKHATYADCARELGNVTPKEVTRAVSREAKRRARPNPVK